MKPYEYKMQFYGYVDRWTFARFNGLPRSCRLKRRHLLYSWPLAERCAASIVLRIPRNRAWSENAMLLRKYTNIPYWMSQGQYEEMLWELGVEL